MTNEDACEAGSAACEVDGIAVAVWHADGTTTWDRADPRVHVTAELVAQAASFPTLWLKYAVTEWCEERQAYHAKLRRAVLETDLTIRLDQPPTERT